MATQEARALLAELMGRDRNAPLPRGAAIPSKKKKRYDDDDVALSLRLHKKSCYDRDVDPLYAAWGVDVYELFVNTKSDLGPNPNEPDDAARAEYLSLPPQEQERLGFEHRLFHKLSDLVRGCDRAIARNEDKLRLELQRKKSQGRAENLFVEVIDEAALEGLCRAVARSERLEQELAESLESLREIVDAEDMDKAELEALLDRKRRAEQEEKSSDAKAAAEDLQDPAAPNEDGDKAQEPSTGKNETGTAKEEEPAGGAIEDVPGDEAATAALASAPDEVMSKAQAEGNKKNGDENDKNEGGEPPPPPHDLTEEEIGRTEALRGRLGRATLDRQRVLHRVAHLVRELVPLHEAVRSNRKSLLTVRSDITTDKTVCHVSGNFLSARDADERIAAHYAGKQYQGWRLVRDKLREMKERYGRHGPPAPPPSSHQRHDPQPYGGSSRGGVPPPPPPSGSMDDSGRHSRRPAGGYYGDRSYSQSGSSRGRYDDGPYGGGGDRGGRWERHGPNPPPPHGGGRGRSGGGGWRR